MKILAVQNKMGIGDTVIFLPFIKALFKKFNSPISLLVKENSKADQYLDQTNYIDKIIILEKDIIIIKERMTLLVIKFNK